MSDDTPKAGKQTAELESLIEQQQIRGVTYDFPDGPVRGYEWRLRVTYPPSTAQGHRTEWLPWVFGSTESVEQMLREWQQYIQLTSMPPNSPVQ